MDITPAVTTDKQLIEAYGDGGFKVAGARHDHPIIVLPQVTVAWAIDGFEDITIESLAPLRDAAPAADLLLLGCGRSMRLLPAPLREAIRAWGVVIEAMDTGAACRTYNVLLAEERRVAAALIPVD